MHMPFKKSDLPWFIELLTLTAVVIGLTFGAIELRQLRAAQEAQAILQLFETIKSEEYVAATNLVLSLPYGLSAKELTDRLGENGLQLTTQLVLTYESLGVLVYRRDVSLQWVDEMFRMMILQTWDKLGPLAIDYRKSSGYLGYNEWVQWLAEQLRNFNEEQPIPAYEAYKDWRP
jgi:hypothetical protein